MTRFSKYIPTGEPVLTINLVAAFILAAIVKGGEQFGIAWDEETLTLMGILAFAAATALARSSVFSPRTYAEDVKAALETEPPA
jgi:hypothetical protein